MAQKTVKNKPQRVKTGNWLSNLKIWQKLLLIAMGFLAPLILLMSLLINNQNTQIGLSITEQVGTRYLDPAVSLLQNAQQHRDLMNQWLRGDNSAKPGIDATRKALRENLEQLKKMDGMYGQQLKTSEILSVLEERLGSILQYDLNVPAETSWDAHSLFIKDQVINLINQASTGSKLILDTDLNTRWLINSLVSTLPKLTESLSQTRGYGAGILVGQKTTPEQLVALAAYTGSTNQLNNELQQAINLIAVSNIGLGSTVISDYNSVLGPMAEFSRSTNGLILNNRLARLSSTDYFNLGSLPLEKSFTLYHTGLKELDRLIGLRVEQMQRSQLIQLLAIAIALALTFLLIATIIQRITLPLGKLYQASLKLAQGNLNAQVEVESLDEVGALSKTFNESIALIRSKAESDAQERERNTQLQTNISEFLGVAMDVAQGDLTKKGKVTEDVLGSVVDAINVMTDEIAQLLLNVQQAAQSVNQGAEQMDSLTDSIASDAQTQASEVIQVRERAQQATQTIREMAEQASASAKQAQQTLEVAQAGRLAVNATLSGMTDLRIEIQGISEQVRQLSIQSTEIETIAKTLEDFASQTNLLALNASFEAAGAGTFGRRFAVIADEIRSLAESSAREVSRVGSLVKEVQSNIGGVVAMAHDGVRQVESGYQVANTAGQRLEQISNLVSQTAVVAEQIAKLAQGQVAEVEQVSLAVQNIAQTVANTEQESLQGRQAAQDIRQLAETLSSNLSRFRLPG